jgi:hypothetical protein
MVSQPSNAETTRMVSAGSAMSSAAASAMPASATPENPTGEVRVDFRAFTRVPTRLTIALLGQATTT